MLPARDGLILPGTTGADDGGANYMRMIVTRSKRVAVIYLLPGIYLILLSQDYNRC